MAKEFLGVYRLDSADFPLFDPNAYEPVNLARLERAIARVVSLLNDPEALGARAMALRDGTARPIEGLA